MAGTLSAKKVAMLVVNGFERVEMTEPRRALEREGSRAPPTPGRRGWPDSAAAGSRPLALSPSRHRA